MSPLFVPITIKGHLSTVAPGHTVLSIWAKDHKLVANLFAEWLRGEVVDEGYSHVTIERDAKVIAYIWKE